MLRLLLLKSFPVGRGFRPTSSSPYLTSGGLWCSLAATRGSPVQKEGAGALRSLATHWLLSWGPSLYPQPRGGVHNTHGAAQRSSASSAGTPGTVPPRRSLQTARTRAHTHTPHVVPFQLGTLALQQTWGVLGSWLAGWAGLAEPGLRSCCPAAICPCPIACLACHGLQNGAPFPLSRSFPSRLVFLGLRGPPK